MRSLEVTNVESAWDARLARVLQSQSRVDTTGMTRPPRDAEERSFLEAKGQLGPFVEAESPAL